MTIIHGVAKAHHLDLIRNEVVTVVFLDKGGKDILLPSEIDQFVLKRMNKNVSNRRDFPLTHNLSDLTLELRFTYGEYKNFAAIALCSPRDYFTKKQGTDIVRGRLKRAAGEIKGGYAHLPPCVVDLERGVP